MPYDPPPEIAALSLSELAEAVAARTLPPVEQWSPSHSGDSHMRIAADGRWFHEGGEITRPAMIRAFASLLFRDEDRQHWLLTPSQRLSVEVEDAAFIATDMVEREGALAFRINIDEIVLAGPDNPLRAAGEPEQPAIYLAIRHGCEARLNRSTWLQLAEHVLAKGSNMAVTSQGANFALVPA